MAPVTDSAVAGTASGLPDFTAVDPAALGRTIRDALRVQSEQIAALAAADVADADWLAGVERVRDAVERTWNPVAHLNSVVSSPALRDAYNECLPLITGFLTELGQNEALFRRFERLEQAPAVASDPAGAELVRLNLRDFRLGGVALSGDDKNEFRDLKLALSSAQARFEQNLMDATDAFSHHVTDESELAGLPQSVVSRA